MTTPSVRHFIYWFLLAVVFLVCLNFAGATTVHGTIKRNGQAFNGYVDISLIYPATSGTALNLPGSTGHIPINNGYFPPMVLDGNDTLLPRGTYYQVSYLDAYASPVASMKYAITGADFDIGSAVPTPVTPANINFLDLTGLRNVSTQNLSITNSFSLGTAVYSQTGISGAKQVDDLRFASGYLTSSTTCGVAEAQSALPSTGGIVYLPLGACTATTPIAITKPLVLSGAGAGSLLAAAITISSRDVTLADFALTGDVAASIVEDIRIDHMTISGGVTFTSVTSPYIVNSFITGSSIAGVTYSGTTSRAGIRDSVISGNSGDGVLVSGGTTDVAISNSTISSNTVNGVENTSSAASIHLTATTLTDNHYAGALLSGGFGHSVVDSTILPGAHQLYGITANYASTAGYTQIEVRNSTVKGNLTYDYQIGASITGWVFFPLAVPLTDSSVHTSIAGGAVVHYIAFSNIAATDYYWTFTGCGTGAGQPTQCTGTTALPGNMPDANYQLFCQVNNTNAANHTISLHQPSLPTNPGSSIGYALSQVMQNGTGGDTPQVYCHAHHN